MSKRKQQPTSMKEEEIYDFADYDEFEEEEDESGESVYFEKIYSKKRMKDNMRRNARRRVEDYLESKAFKKKFWDLEDEYYN